MTKKDAIYINSLKGDVAAVAKAYLTNEKGARELIRVAREKAARKNEAKDA